MALNGAYDLTSPGGYNQYAQSLGVSGSNPGRPLARRLNVAQGGLALQQMGFRMGLEPQRQSAILRMLMNFSPGNRGALKSRNRAGIMENAAEGSNVLNSVLTGQGYGQGARVGAQRGLVGQGLSQANQYDQYLDSPEYEDQVLQSIMKAIFGSTDQDLVSGLYGGSGQIQQSNLMKEPDNDLFGQTLGQGLGLLAQSGWNPFKKAPPKVK